jgi:hypothetical protein
VRVIVGHDRKVSDQLIGEDPTFAFANTKVSLRRLAALSLRTHSALRTGNGRRRTYQPRTFSDGPRFGPAVGLR